MRRWFASVFVLAVAFIASEARAGSCTPGPSPFTDVPDNSIFCSEALWLRNALVTLGCGNGTTYCPNDPVSRAQMALFMKRLARAVTPDIVYVDVPAAPGDLDGNGYAPCVTAPYTIPANANVRILTHAMGTVSVLTDAPADMFVDIQTSVNGGLFGNFGANGPRAQVPGTQWTVVPVIGGQTMTGGAGALLVPGSTYQWRILLQRLSGPTTGEVTSNRCQLLIQVAVDATQL